MFSQFELPDGDPNENAILEQTSVLAALSRDSQAQAQEIFAAVEGNCQILHWQFDPRGIPPCRAVVRQNNSLFVYVGGTNRGTLNLGNVIGAGVSVVTGIEGVNTNSFFLYVTQRIQVPILESLPAGWQNMPMHFIGHSQGSAVALMLGVFWKRSLGLLSYDWMGLASPRAFCGSNLLPVNLQPRQGYVVCNQQDGVTIIPPDEITYAVPFTDGNWRWGGRLTWRHYGKLLTINSDNSATITNATERGPRISPAYVAGIARFHPISVYLASVARMWSAANG